MRRSFFLFCTVCWLASFGLASTAADAQTTAARRVRVAVLDLGETPEGRSAADVLAGALSKIGGDAKAETQMMLLDRDLSRVAARGQGYAGSLNMSLAESRDLGAAVGCDFFITGESQTLRRSSSATPVYYEAYASVFVVSARTGRLVAWERQSFEAATPQGATDALRDELRRRADARYAASIIEAQVKEEGERRAQLLAPDDGAVLFEDLTGGDAATTTQGNLRAPMPFRRLSPAYTNEAARAEVEATVDVLVRIGADGEVSGLEVARWAGFGLDESVADAVRRMHFRPATRGGSPVPVRVLLRYNFRRPPKSSQQAQQDKH